MQIKYIRMKGVNRYGAVADWNKRVTLKYLKLAEILATFGEPWFLYCISFYNWMLLLGSAKLSNIAMLEPFGHLESWFLVSKRDKKEY